MHAENRDQAMSAAGDSPAELAPSRELLSRRQIVRTGIKLAFTAPIVSTFLASEAHAAASRRSCYPTGHACGVGSLEPCCNGSCSGGVCP